MYKPRRESYSDRRPSAPRYGDSYPRRENRDRGGFGGGDREDRPSFEATCAKCGSSCRVPFKPNGTKPVLCKPCFEQEGGGSRDRDRGRDSYQDRGRDSSRSRDSYQEKPMVRSLEREDVRPAGNVNLEAQLKRIEAKLDSLLETLGPKTEKKIKESEVKEEKVEKVEKKEKAKKEEKTEKKAKKAKKEPEEEIIFE